MTSNGGKGSGYDFNGTDIIMEGSAFVMGDVVGAKNVLAAMNVSAGINVLAVEAVSAPVLVGRAVSVGIAGMSSQGSIATKGIITSEADVVAGQTSLRSHTHMVPLPQHGAGMIPSQLATPTAASIPAAPYIEPTVPIEPVQVNAEPTASSADAAEPLPAYFPSRVPQHEPFTRSYLKKDETDKDEAGESTLDLFDAVQNDIDSVLEYDSTNPAAGTGSTSRGKDFARNAKWRR